MEAFEVFDHENNKTVDVREVVFFHVKRLQAGLSGKDCKQWCDALITVREPVVFTPDGELL